MKHAVMTTALAAMVAVLATIADGECAQGAAGQPDTLRQQLEQRFDVTSLQDGVLLRPIRGDARFRAIEVNDRSIAIDGAAVTGAELRSRLGADADVVLRVSYLDAEARRQLLGSPAAPLPDRSVERPVERTDEQSSDTDEGRRPRRRRGDRDGSDRVRFGGNVSVEDGEIVNGDVVSIGGSARVNGEVRGDAVAIGGGLELGPHANVRGDAVSVGGALKRDPGARVDGKVVDIGGGWAFRPELWRWNRFPRSGFPPFGANVFGAAAGMFALMGTLMRVLVLCLLSSIVLFVGREYVERVGARAAAEPLKAGAIGLLAQLLIGPVLVLTIVVFVVTIVGIPLLLLVPFAMLAFGGVLLIGFTAVAYHLGRLANARFAWHHDNTYLTAVTGIMMLVSPVLIARVLGLADWLLFPLTGTLVFLGLVAEYLAWTVGFGAVALLKFDRAPPVPPAVSV
ncbi:MAG: polymer-forming cytoskeletal protein [Acidobacteriota bacterium]